MILNKDRDGTKGQIRSKLVKIGKFTIKIWLKMIKTKEFFSFFDVIKIVNLPILSSS